MLQLLIFKKQSPRSKLTIKLFPMPEAESPPTLIDLETGEPMDFSWASVPAQKERIMLGVWLAKQSISWPDAQLLAYFLQIPIPTLRKSELHIPLGVFLLESIGDFYKAQRRSWVIEQLFTISEQEKILWHLQTQKQKISRLQG